MSVTVCILGADETVRQELTGRLQETEAHIVDGESNGFAGVACVYVVGPQHEELIASLRQTPFFNSAICAVVGRNMNAEGVAALAAGADDVLMWPAPLWAVQSRTRVLATLTYARQQGRFSGIVARFSHWFSTSNGTEESLCEGLRITAEAQGFARCAALGVHADGSRAYVIAATDRETQAKLTLALDDYPELQAVVSSEQLLYISDTKAHELTKGLGDLWDQRGVRRCLVIPTHARGRINGLLFFRDRSVGPSQLTAEEVMIAEFVAASMGTHMGGERVLRRLEEGQELSRVELQAEQRLRTLEFLGEHFEATSDGVVLVDNEGIILYANREADQILQITEDHLVGSCLFDLAEGNYRTTLREEVDAVLSNRNIDPFDVLLLQDGRHQWLSIASSTVLSETEAAVLVIRDVTEEREMAHELRRTKEFLEQLLNSTVDGIIASDFRGNVIVFNRGAEEIYGYDANEVVGQISVSALYQQGVAQEVMQALREQGRIEAVTKHIPRKDGTLVPVSLSAAIVYDGEREVATVGVFHDLRERLAMEQRIVSTEERLAEREKLAVAAELAGVTAHELNQPLTSILGFAELLQRDALPEGKRENYTKRIREEAERMAEIVRKLGRITSYQTAPYVGGTDILDLGKSSS